MNQDESCVVVERQLPCFGMSTTFWVEYGGFLLICHVGMVDMLIYLYLYAVSLMNVSRLQLEYVYRSVHVTGTKSSASTWRLRERKYF